MLNVILNQQLNSMGFSFVETPEDRGRIPDSNLSKCTNHCPRGKLIYYLIGISSADPFVQIDRRLEAKHTKFFKIKMDCY